MNTQVGPKSFELSELQLSEFHQKGFLLVNKGFSRLIPILMRFQVLPCETVRSFVEECDSLINLVYQEGLDIVKDFGCILEPFNSWFLENIPQGDDCEPLTKTLEGGCTELKPHTIHRQRISFFDSLAIKDAIINTLAPIAASVLPEGDLYLWNEQYIVKPPLEEAFTHGKNSDSTKFGWHQDREYLPRDFQSTPTLAIWIPLQPIYKNNGGLVFQPYPCGSKQQTLSSKLTILDFPINPSPQHPIV
ncbi:hypothetical protein DSO57_1017810 [Entomophthora muscae]|uniref:Uncharacterized protein n=1 Tax=Entomophthora muscae TaxID=34485 RepID=A0ACC2TS60_9FUNG|nr:hypothetical protein DSO57_1017810 [Entomophthora muscae]